MIHPFVHLFKQLTPHTILCSCELHMSIQLLISSTNVFNCYFEPCIFPGAGDTANGTRKHDPCFHKAHFITEQKERKEIHNISYSKYFEEKNNIIS